jgi:hypothetical protein
MYFVEQEQHVITKEPRVNGLHAFADPIALDEETGP